MSNNETALVSSDRETFPVRRVRTVTTKTVETYEPTEYLEDVEQSNVMTMDSRDIAELTGKRHADVCRDIRDQLGQLGGLSRFASSYLNEQNKQQPCYKLPYRETMILVSGYSVELRSRVVDKWMELERQKKYGMIPDFANPVIAARAWANEVEQKQLIEKKYQESEIKLLEADKQIEEMAPKAEGFDKVMHSNETFSATEIAKELGFNSAKAFNDWAKERKIQFKNKNIWVPTAKYAKSGYYRTKSKLVQEGTEFEKVVYYSEITPEGRLFFIDLYMAEQMEKIA